jgi:hypothetical protein
MLSPSHHPSGYVCQYCSAPRGVCQTLLFSTYNSSSDANRRLLPLTKVQRTIITLMHGQMAGAGALGSYSSAIPRVLLPHTTPKLAKVWGSRRTWSPVTVKGEAVPCGSPVAHIQPSNGAVAEVEGHSTVSSIIEVAKKAQEIYSTFSQEQVDQVRGRPLSHLSSPALPASWQSLYPQPCRNTTPHAPAALPTACPQIFKEAALAANSARIPLAQMAVEETDIGLVEDKVRK